MPKTQHKKNNILWIILSIIALAALLWLVLVITQQGREERRQQNEFEAQQEYVNDFIESTPELNTAERIKMNQSFFGS